jgi:hypothetical protein
MDRKIESDEFKKSECLLLGNENPINPFLISYSALMKRVKEYGGAEIRTIKDSVNQRIGIRVMNSTFVSLCQEAYGSEFRYSNRIILDTDQKDVLKIPDDVSKRSSWLDSNLYCYELFLPVSQRDNLYKFMQSDLNRYLPFTVRIEKRKVKCLLLKRISTEIKINSKGGIPVKQYANGKIIIRNQPLQASLFSMIAYANSHLPTPVIDKTNFDQCIDIEITDHLKDLRQVRKDLNKYGLDLQPGVAEIEMLVISK